MHRRAAHINAAARRPVTESIDGLPVLRRAIAEHRALVIALAVAFVVNVFMYALVVYPLSERVANIEQRDQAAEDALAQARTDHAHASGTLTGKTRASAQLATFYEDVLPRDLAGARRLTYLRLARLARGSNLQYERSSYDPIADTGSTLTRLQIQMVLSGSYANMRDFIHQLETAPEFVVIDSIQLMSGRSGNGSLDATLRLSTYYRLGKRNS
jgi:Tfp pilus assembly protein PilO